MTLRTDDAFALLRRAVAADTTDFLAFDTYWRVMRDHGRFATLRREFPAMGSGSDGAACRAVLARFPVIGHPEPEPLIREFATSRDSTGCAAALVMRLRPAGSASQRLADVRAALARAPDHPMLWVMYAQRLQEANQRRDAVAALRQSARVAIGHPWFQLDLHAARADLWRRMGDTVRGAALSRALLASASRDHRPWVRLWGLAYATSLAPEKGTWAADTLTRQRLQLARAHRVPALEHAILVAAATEALDRHDHPARAARLLTRALHLADSIGAPELAATTRLRRGRAYAKLGWYERAVHDLSRALPLREESAPTQRAEVHHNLAHAYEGLGHWADAAREADLYVRHSRFAGSFSALYMMSLRDAGMIRWKAGWHGAALTSFGAMVREIDRRGENFFYAGEYFERVGDLQRAAAYYRRGVATGDRSELAQNLAGLSRIYDALGLRDSVRVLAARHDEPSVARGDARLLPAALLAEGRVEEALRLARHDIAAQNARGSVEGAAAARLRLAGLLLDAGRWSAAVAEAVAAEEEAARAQLAGTRIDAMVVAGIARTRARDGEAVATLLRARELLQATPVASAQLDVELALGDAFVVAGRRSAALSAYDRAARASEEITSSFDSAIDRARNRARRIAPFDAALRLLLAGDVTGNAVDDMLAWSARRKRALLPTTNAGEGPRHRWPAGAQQRDTSSVLLDYLAIDGKLHVLVASKTRRTAIQLPLSLSQLRVLAERLRRPFTATNGGMLDLARARFDHDVARQLYQGLVAPVESWLKGATSVVVVPDDAVHAVPFAALPTGALAGGDLDVEYLIDRHVITYATSADASAPHMSARPARVLVVGAGAPGAARELAEVARSWPGAGATVLAGTRASEAALRNTAGAHTILHLAVHARIHETDALASHLQLSRGGADDGLLHVSEIPALGFRGDLVVLTACETLPGPRFAGTGPFGIAGAFIGGGAASVVATHWPIGESAAELSAALHRGLAEGAAPAVALRQAQLALRRDPTRAHPFYWGGYVLISGRTHQGN